jgi:NAD(P)-dependent dehydrogenase (short-subunit alcohol dehydrogenase family)
VSLAGKTVLVTAGGGNVGRRIVAAFLGEGTRVIAVDLDPERLEEVRERSSGVEVVAADISTPDGADRAMATAGGHVDVLCNNAALMDTLQVDETDDAVWEDTMRVNVTAAFLLSKRAIPGMIARGGGVIVNTGSIAGLRGGRGGASYTVSKHALVGLTQNIAATFDAKGIRCNMVAPGSIERPEGSPEAKLEGHSPNFVHRGSLRAIHPDDIASLVVYLARDDAKSINGAVIPIDAALLAT